MQKTLEVLKNEDGVTIKKLSYRKLLVVYTIPIFLGQDTQELSQIEYKMRYIQDDEEDGKHFNLLYPKHLIVGLSQKYGIKVKNISLDYSFGKYIKLDKPFNDEVDEIIIDHFIDEIRFKDPNWIRDYKLKQILYDDSAK